MSYVEFSILFSWRKLLPRINGFAPGRLRLNCSANLAQVYSSSPSADRNRTVRSPERKVLNENIFLLFVFGPRVFFFPLFTSTDLE